MTAEFPAYMEKVASLRHSLSTAIQESGSCRVANHVVASQWSRSF